MGKIGRLIDLLDHLFGHSPNYSPNEGEYTGEGYDFESSFEGRELEWTVKTLFDKFPFQVGDKSYLALIDTGLRYGAIINYDDFVELVKSGTITKVRSKRPTLPDGTKLDGYKQGIGTILFQDNDGNQRTFENITIGSFPTYQRRQAILGKDFLSRFHPFSLYMEEDGWYFQAAFTKKPI